MNNKFLKAKNRLGNCLIAKIMMITIAAKATVLIGVFSARETGMWCSLVLEAEWELVVVFEFSAFGSSSVFPCGDVCGGVWACSVFTFSVEVCDG